jgi:hypothetical protein
MTNTTKPASDFLFTKKNKVSVWVSTVPYADIPDEYFEESYTKNDTRATNQWTKNFRIRYFNPDLLETNGSMDDTMKVKQAVGECSYSSSFFEVLMSKAKKKKVNDITWMVLLYECEYSSKLTGIEKDEYLRLLGAFDYNDEAGNLYEIDYDDYDYSN